MELNENELHNVYAGDSEEIARQKALENPQMYRVKKIEQLKSQINEAPSAFQTNDFPYDLQQVDPQVFEYLRSHTNLGPIASVKLADARISYPAVADELEYELRMHAWERGCSKAWKTNPDGTSLSEYAYETLTQQLQNEMGNLRR